MKLIESAIRHVNSNSRCSARDQMQYIYIYVPGSFAPRVKIRHELVD